jgi:hypothetical protein
MSRSVTSRHATPCYAVVLLAKRPRLRSRRPPLTVLLLAHPSLAVIAGGTGAAGSTAWQNAGYCWRGLPRGAHSQERSRTEAKQVSSQERQAIIAALKGAGHPMSVSQIMAAVERTDRNAVDQLLFKMRKAGEVEVAGRGLYTLGKIGAPVSTPAQSDQEQSYREGQSDRQSNQDDLTGDWRRIKHLFHSAGVRHSPPLIGDDFKVLLRCGARFLRGVGGGKPRF